MVDLRKLGTQEDLRALLQVHRGGQIQAGGPDELDADGTFVELRDEIGPETRVADGGCEGRE